MTTPEAAASYLAEHQRVWYGQPYAVWNPFNLNLEELPVIYGINNGGSRGWYDAVSFAEDGTFLGNHICSDECYMPSDLGMLEGSRPDRHENDYRKHYPNGYRCEWVASSNFNTHEKLQAVIKLIKEKADAQREASS